MSEKEFSLDNAMLVWWFITWRTVLVFFAINIVSAVFETILGPESFFGSMSGWIAIILMILTQVIFIRMAVNREYKSKKNGNFRLSAVDVSTSAAQSPSDQSANQ